MSHLIQTIDIEGTRYCVKHGATTPKWRTVSFVYDDMELVSAEDDDAWQLPDSSGSAHKVGSIQFWTCCIWKATVRFTVTTENDRTIGGLITINGEIVGGFGFEFEYQGGGSGPEVVDIEVDLNALGIMGRACGNEWSIYTEIDEFDGSGMTIEIIDVTFGPPV